ncbi:flagellar motor switch protein FliM [Fluoribacter dumoffii]|uniref:Flagellar motor switch protein FliM n=1 Tax=Fluoribacter dumoffii TaxID=463 RepID=A0A377G9M8_9GAMM|nr:flagellar motor switch protein FliM [Fluoribacter dumoffii]KTC89970.1 flagellar protein [Fluoribacter dumoffii NY 23]MCW8385267.1 flagellar motor switch protein FliM [Fluoribacter dumoffii]MCW8496436.1 flagellar motor switch protein FliM [Fluoribacter dumoffii]STO21088.1 Flagellar motor switch protein FliM [Fluoribacter dumoffii]
MVDKNVLSQEEIDALLKTVGENSENQNSEGAEGTKEAVRNKKASSHKKQVTEAVFETIEVKKENEVKTLNFTAQERIVKGKLPVLDRIYDRAVRLFAADIYNVTAKDFEIKQDPLLIVKHRDFMESLPNPSLMCIFKFKPLRGKGIILFDSTFVYDLVDYYFGGSSQFFAQKDKTDFTATELRVMDVITKKLIANLTQAWKPIIQLDITKFNDETNPQLVNIAEPQEMLIVTRFSMDFGKEIGTFYFVLPYSMVEPIKEQLELGASRPDDEIDPNWIKSLKEELMDVELTVSSIMAETKSTLGAVMSWQIGDFIPMEMKEEVTLDIEGTPGFTATQGTANDKRAVKIIKNISY